MWLWERAGRVQDRSLQLSSNSHHQLRAAGRGAGTHRSPAKAQGHLGSGQHGEGKRTKPTREARPGRRKLEGPQLPDPARPTGEELHAETENPTCPALGWALGSETAESGRRGVLSRALGTPRPDDPIPLGSSVLSPREKYHPRRCEANSPLSSLHSTSSSSSPFPETRAPSLSSRTSSSPGYPGRQKSTGKHLAFPLFCRVLHLRFAASPLPRGKHPRILFICPPILLMVGRNRFAGTDWFFKYRDAFQDILFPYVDK